MQLIDLQAQRRRLGNAVEVAISRVLDHGQFVMGPEVRELETELAARSGVAHAVSCASGTDALLLVLLAWGVGPGDAVFVPAFTFPATAEVVTLLGATPVFVDVDAATFNIDPGSLARGLDLVVSGSLRPAAVIAVDLFGQPADYIALEEVVGTTGMPVLADAAQSFGAQRGGVPVGKMAVATATSFFPSKPLGCYGDGGAVLTDDSELAACLRSLRVHGQGSNKYDNVRTGVNSRLDTIQAAILLAKLLIFDDELSERSIIAATYNDLLAGVALTPTLQEDATSAWAQYTIRLDGRDHVAAQLRAAGVPTAVYYPKPLHHQPAFVNGLVSPGGVPEATRLCETVLSLPMHAYLKPEDQELVAKTLAASLIR